MSEVSVSQQFTDVIGHVEVNPDLTLDRHLLRVDFADPRDPVVSEENWNTDLSTDASGYNAVGSRTSDGRSSVISDHLPVIALGSAPHHHGAATVLRDGRKVV